ncbi:hypothetical protein VLK31_20880 [Variovorax sp. H27-G14]|uniref:hypothetical protein n=1 Tax=Variovorax sp. H27-G14 TaxID=3111914 RepID=UPI0038FD083E
MNMFPFPQNAEGCLPPQERMASIRSPILRGHLPARAVPRIAKSQLLRLALAERMCDLMMHQPAVRPVPVQGWQPAYAPHGGVITPLTAQWLPRWETMGCGDTLLTVKAFSKACISTSAADTSAFNHTPRGWKANRLGNSFLDVAPLIEFWSQARRGDLRFDPQVELAIDVFQQVGLAEGTAMGPLGQVECWFAQGYAIASVAVRVNAFVNELGKRGRQVRTARKVHRHEDLHTARGREVRSYLTGALRRHPGSHVMRFELCVSRNTKVGREDEYDFMLEASTRYERELKEMFGTAIVADVRKIDRGNTSRYLVHFLLALDGPRPAELIAIRQTASDRWNAQMQGIGYLVNTNEVDSFVYRGMGKQSGRCESTEIQLIKAAAFLADTDRVIQVGSDGMHDGLIFGICA